jgi:hypothetical protein
MIMSIFLHSKIKWKNGLYVACGVSEIAILSELTLISRVVICLYLIESI